MLLEESKTGSAPSARLTLDGEATLDSPFQSFCPLGSGDCDDGAGMGDGRTWVLLYRLSRGAPADYDFPATRAALRGQTAFASVEFAEVESLGERHFVGITGDGNQARALVQRIKAQVPGSAPQAFCRQLLYPNRLMPVNVKRSLRFDLRTGELLPGPATPATTAPAATTP